MTEVARILVDPARAVVYEHGWQSWSPTWCYRLDERPYRPATEARRAMNYRPGRVPPDGAFGGEGLLAVDPGTGEDLQVFAAPGPAGPIASIHAERCGDVLAITADAPVDRFAAPAAAGLGAALAGWADGFAARAAVGPIRPAPTLWCSWYHYFTEVTEADVDENVAALDDLGVAADVVQLDDGYQAEIGDWLTLSGRFASLAGIVDRIREHGRRAGIWVAPFLVSPRSRLADEHPEWLLAGASAGHNWGADQLVLDSTHEGAREHLRTVFSTLRGCGIDLFKIDFVYAGALDGPRADPTVSGVQAYRDGLRVIREAIGPDAYLLGCGAPILPSVGLVDAMRIGPDIAAQVRPPDGDLSQPSQLGAARNARSRSWQHGRFWVNDADCLIAAPGVQDRERWAECVEHFGGLRASGDRLRGLDDWGLATTRRLVRPVPATTWQP